MPNITEIIIDPAVLTAAPNKSALIPLNNAQRATLIVQTAAGPGAGVLTLKVLMSNDLTIPGQTLITTNFPATGRVNSQSADVCHMYAYVEQTTPFDVALQKVSLYLR
jgi:hypothetical protein